MFNIYIGKFYPPLDHKQEFFYTKFIYLLHDICGKNLLNKSYSG